MSKMSKKALIDHLDEWHGTMRCVTPPDELARWTAYELEIHHRQMTENGGGCSLLVGAV
jgi:hypothetical protein